MGMSELAIETSSLQKIYRRKAAVADLTLQVPRGEVFGFLGPNGSGKSTSVKMLLGLVRPTSGSARVLGHPPGHSPTMARIGFLPEHFRFHEWLQASELLDLHGRLYGMDAATRRRRIPELLDLVRLGDQATRPLAGFSKGMLQRIGLAQALLNAPELVFLDEPTSALDPFGRMLVRTIIRDLTQQGTTIFLNSHLLSEVEATCDRVSFIREGRVLRTITLHDNQTNRLLVEARVGRATPALLETLEGLTGADVQRQRVENSKEQQGEAEQMVLELKINEEAMLPAIAERIVASGAQLFALVPRRASLEQLFLDIVGTDDSGQ